MSYQITVVVKDGKATVDDSGTSLPPDGKFTINGHVPSPGTWAAEHIQATRYADGGQNITIQASATYPIPQ